MMKKYIKDTQYSVPSTQYHKGFTLINLLLLRKRFCEGFTLIELMVAIAIIAILATIGLLAYSSVQKNSRDQRRLRDLNLIKQALELYRTDNGYYPPLRPARPVLRMSYYTLDCSTTTLTSPDNKKYYLTEMIKDPLCTTQTYQYLSLPSGCVGTGCTGFALCAKREGSGVSSSPAACAGLACGGVVGDCNMGIAAD